MCFGQIFIFLLETKQARDYYLWNSSEKGKENERIGFLTLYFCVISRFFFQSMMLQYIPVSITDIWKIETVMCSRDMKLKPETHCLKKLLCDSALQKTADNFCKA